MRVLITGASGFAGGYLAQLCAGEGDEVIGVSRHGSVPSGTGQGRALDLRDGDAVARLLEAVQPEVVYHLAALSSVGRSWEQPSDTVQSNVGTAINVLDGLRVEAPDARVVWVSSCEVYGNSGRLPFDEGTPMNPANPYAVSKTTGDMLAGIYADAYGLNLARVRPFNHAGPGQLPTFILSSLAKQTAEALNEEADTIRIVTGNPETRRDFTDVRDIVRAYRLLAATGDRRAHNVCSGRSISATEHVELIAELVSPKPVEHVVDPALARAHEVMDVRGSNERIHATTGWTPEIPLRQTMLDTIRWWQRELHFAAADGAGASSTAN